MARIEPLAIHEVDEEIRHACAEAEHLTRPCESGWGVSTR
jgi:hypothetical protein